MNMQVQPIKTIKGRFEEHAAILRGLPEHMQTICMMMFYAGFASCLEAEQELATLDLSDETAARVLMAWHAETRHMGDAVAVTLAKMPLNS